MLAAFKSRYDAFAQRVLASLSEIERRDVRAFDLWFYAQRGWQWLIGIVVATTLVAWLASQLPWNMSFGEAAILFNLVVLTLIWSGLSAWFGYRRFQGRIFRYVVGAPLLALLGALVGASIAGVVQGIDPFAFLSDSAKLRHVVTAALVFGFLFALVTALIASLRHREYQALTAHFEAEARQSETSRQLAESKLKLLQLQIEPHFLFNTLGSAQQLAEKGAPDAARLIADLIRFLRAATPAMRDEVTTLKAEAGMIRAYLGIMQTRLSRRLTWNVQVPDELAEIAIPPGMLITLTENAIKHGIEPRPQGGSIDVSAERRGAQLVLTVADTGAGFSNKPTDSGIGLANIRERLELLYGRQASLDLEENVPRGVRARILMPVLPPARATVFAPSDPGVHPT
ncbi:MAG: histidine kinase [Casimicrobiaceae bacterium]